MYFLEFVVDMRQPGSPLESDASLVSSVLESASDAIIIFNYSLHILSFNAAAERLFGGIAPGQPLSRFLPGFAPGDARSTTGTAERRAPDRSTFAGLRGRRDDGQALALDAALVWTGVGTDRAGILTLREAAQTAGTEPEPQRCRHLYRTLLHANRVIAASRSRDELFRQVCRVVVTGAGFDCAWIGWHHPGMQEIERVAECAESGIAGIALRTSLADRGSQEAPAATAFRTGRPAISRDQESGGAMDFGPDTVDRAGIGGVACLPIRLGGAVTGILTVHAQDFAQLNDDTIDLLAEIATSLSLALDGMVRDDEHMAAQERLKQSERKYRELVEDANSIILRWSHTGVIKFINEFGQKFFGYTEDELVGRHVMGTIVPMSESGGRDLHNLMEQICADPKAFEQNVNENITRSGQRVWIAWTNRVVWDAAGSTAEILSIGTDITERRQAEQEVHRLHSELQRHAEELELRVAERTAELQTALVRAESADRTKSAFLASMSHELRTPLNSIIGFTGIILQGLAGPLTPEQTKQLGMVRGSARHLLRLINDILDISKIESGTLRVHPAPFDLIASVETVAASMRPLADSKGLSLEVILPPPPCPVVSDQRRVEQVLLNLLNNAMKFTERGHVALTLEPVLLPRVGRAMDIRIADTGIGIKSEDLTKLFQPFHQIETGQSRHHEGTGLGLAISRRLAELLGAAISVESDWGRGSVFTFRLPLGGETEGA